MRYPESLFVFRSRPYQTAGLLACNGTAVTAAASQPGSISYIV
jgi:hypothetical protein